MRRSTLRLLAALILAILGAPLVMHVVMHDHQDHDGGGFEFHGSRPGHSDHQHPILSSVPPQQRPQTAATVASQSNGKPEALLRCRAAVRNVIAFGALRLDDDVGLQSLLSTFLI